MTTAYIDDTPGVRALALFRALLAGEERRAQPEMGEDVPRRPVRQPQHAQPLREDSNFATLAYEACDERPERSELGRRQDGELLVGRTYALETLPSPIEPHEREPVYVGRRP